MLKKILMFLLVVLLAIVAGCIALYSVGGKTYTWSTSVSIAATPERIWPWLTESERVTKWVGGLVEDRPMTEGGARVGARSAVVLEDHGERFTMDSEILRYEPGRLMELRFQMTGQMAGTGETIGTYTLEPAGDGTRLTYAVASTSKSWMRVLAPFMRAAVQKRIDTDIASLKRAVEAEPPPPPPPHPMPAK